MKKTAFFVSVFAALLMMTGAAMAADAMTKTAAPAVKKEMVKLTPAEMKKCEDYAKDPSKVMLTKDEMKKCEEAKHAKK